MTHPAGKNVLISTCGAHLIQDGLVALQYVLLPILAQLFGLSYAQVGLLRAVSNTATSILEIPSGFLAEQFGERRLLMMGLAGAGIGYAGVAMSATFVGIVLCFFIAGVGAAFQHSLSSSLLVRTFEDSDRRRALGAYNSFGDAGKLTFTGLFSAAIGAGIAWEGVVILLGISAVLFGLFVLWSIRGAGSDHGTTDKHGALGGSRGSWGIKYKRRFWTLGAIVFLDSTVQAVFLTFLVFVLKHKGVGNATAALGVVIALAGGMVGKFSCGYLAARLGDRAAFVLIQVLTVFSISMLLWLPAFWALAILPLVGIVVQGSSTVTYGSVADYLHQDRQARGYALIYSLANGSSVTGPFVFGLLADSLGLIQSMHLLSLLLIATIVLAFAAIQPASIKTEAKTLQG